MSNERSTRPSCSSTIGIDRTHQHRAPPVTCNRSVAHYSATGRLQMMIRREIVLPAPRDEVWEALTDPERLARLVRERRRARPPRRRRRDVPLGERRGAPRDRDRGRARRAARVRVGRRRRGRVHARRRRRRHAADGRRDVAGLVDRARPAGLRARAVSDPLGQVFSALADPSRRHVLGYIADHGTATATELTGELPITRQAVAKHLATLSEAGLVESERAGRETRYRLTRAAPSGTTGSTRCGSTSSAGAAVDSEPMGAPADQHTASEVRGPMASTTSSATCRSRSTTSSSRSRSARSRREFTRKTTVVHLRGGGARGRRRGRHLRPARARRHRFPRLDLARRVDARVALGAPRDARPLPGRRAGPARLPRLPPLGVRVGGARPRAAAGRAVARRRARPRASPRAFVSSTRATALADGSSSTRSCASSSTRRPSGPTSSCASSRRAATSTSST